MRISAQTAGRLAAALSAVYYFLNRFPGLSFIDSGELALCSYALGVPHPTGYPLYIILTRPVTLFFDRPIEAVTIFSALIAAAAVLVFFRLLFRAVTKFFPGMRYKIILVFCASIVICLAPAVTAQGTTNEVYGLSLVINLAVILSFFRYFHASSPVARTRHLFLAAYLTGLSLTNHLSGVMLIPGLLLAGYWFLRMDIRFNRIVVAAAFFLVPLILYAVLPIRAAAQPPPIANWGDLTTLDGLYRHITGWQYKVWMFAGQWSEIWINLISFTRLMWQQFPPLTWLFLPFGIYLLGKRFPRWLAAVLLVVAVNVFLGINYSIPDIEGYFLLSIALFGLLCFLGLTFIFHRIGRGYVLPVLTAVFLAWQAVAVYEDNYRRDFTLPEDYALNIGRSADFRAVVVSDIWDHHGQAYYLQQAEYFRPDIRFIDKELLRRSWYFRLVKNLYPDLYARISPLVFPFIEELARFEKGDEYDASKLEYHYQAIINRILTSCGTGYVDYGLSYAPENKHYLRPQGLLFRVDTIEGGDRLPQPDLIWRGRPLNDYRDPRARSHIRIIGALTNR